MTLIKTMKQHDLGDPLIVRLWYENDDLDLTGQITLATPVVFTMSAPPPDTTPPPILSEPATITAVASKTVTVRYDWGPGELDTPGTYLGEFQFTLTAGPVTGPTPRYVTIRVLPDLD